MSCEIENSSLLSFHGKKIFFSFLLNFMPNKKQAFWQGSFKIEPTVFFSLKFYAKQKNKLSDKVVSKLNLQFFFFFLKLGISIKNWMDGFIYIVVMNFVDCTLVNIFNICNRMIKVKVLGNYGNNTLSQNRRVNYRK